MPLPADSLLASTPTLRVCFASLLAIRNRTDRRPDFDLLVALDCRFRRTAAFFAPNERELSAHFTVFVIDDAQREHCAFVEAVAAECGQADHFAVLQYLVI